MAVNNKDFQSSEKLLNNSSNENLLIRLSLNAVNQPFIITDLDLKISFVNKAFSRTYGYEPDEIISKPITTIYSDKNKPLVYESIKQNQYKLGWKGTLYHKRKNNKDFLVLLHTSKIKDSSGDEVGYVYSCIDLSDRALIESIFELDEDKYKSLFNQLKETVYESTPDGRILDINPSGLELLGYESKEELLAVDVATSLYKNPEDRNYLVKKLEENGFIKNYEIEIINKEGDILYLLETAIAIKDNSGKTICYRGILHDITETKKNQDLLTQYLEQLATINDQLKESESELRRANNEKDKFFSILSHDLKTPVSAIMSYSEILNDEFDSLSKNELREFISSLNEVSLNLFELLEGILNWSRVQSGRISYCPETINLSGLIEGIIKIYSQTAKKKKINLIAVSEGTVNAFVDENMISTVLRNLVSNAIKFSNTSGKIVLESIEKSDSIQISVIDNGVGIKKEDLDKLFRIDTHHTTAGTANEAGTGLGLILCKELVEKNNGNIDVESTPGEGTRFFFTIPKSGNKNR
jgi:PAS domain S-box-containing protein